MTSPLLQVEGLRTHFFTRAGVVKAAEDVSFSVSTGEVLGFVGESGSGKSIVACSIMGLVDAPGRIIGGRILFDGHDLRVQTPEFIRALRGSRIGMIFQNPMTALNPSLRIDSQMIEAVLAHRRESREAARERAHAALVRVGITAPDEPLTAYPHQLSDGLRQRVAIALALINDPDLVIADEPTRGLDVTLHGHILSEMQRLARGRGAAIIWIAHDLSVIAGLADRVCVMYAGRVVEEGSVHGVLRWPAHPYTRGLIDAVPSRVPRGTRLRAIAGAAPPPLALPSGCAFRERCAQAINACVAVPEMLPIGATLGERGVRCHNPLPIGAVVA